MFAIYSIKLHNYHHKAPLVRLWLTVIYTFVLTDWLVEVLIMNNEHMTQREIQHTTNVLRNQNSDQETNTNQRLILTTFWYSARQKYQSVTIIITRPRRSHSTAAYDRQTFPWMICRSVHLCVCACVGCAYVRASVCPVHCGKMADRIRMPFGNIGQTGPRMRKVVGFGDGYTEGVLFGVNLGRAIVTNEDFTAYMCYSAVTWPSSQITLGRLVYITIIIIS